MWSCIPLHMILRFKGAQNRALSSISRISLCGHILLTLPAKSKSLKEPSRAWVGFPILMEVFFMCLTKTSPQKCLFGCEVKPADHRSEDAGFLEDSNGRISAKCQVFSGVFVHFTANSSGAMTIIPIVRVYYRSQWQHDFTLGIFLTFYHT